MLLLHCKRPCSEDANVPCNAMMGKGSRAGAEESAECEATPNSGGIDTQRGESRRGACAEHSLL
eukprot:2058296-Rhodomonas_salina.1